MSSELHPRRQKHLERLLARLGLAGVEDVQWPLLHLAFVDISSEADRNNEKLEFLGDAALRLASAEFLMETYPELSVGEMAAVRSQLVSDRMLAQWARYYDLEKVLWLSDGAANDIPGLSSRLADTFEAMLGALYLSRGNLSLIRPWLDIHLKQMAQKIQADPAKRNYKAALQELTQAHCKQLPEYRVEEISQVHGDQERFEANVWFQSQTWGQGKGPSIKQAEQEAARFALLPLREALENGHLNTAS